MKNLTSDLNRWSACAFAAIAVIVACMAICGCNVPNYDVAAFRASLDAIAVSSANEAEAENAQVELLEQIRDSLQPKCSNTDCDCEDCDETDCDCDSTAPSEAEQHAESSIITLPDALPSFRVPVTIEGETYELDDYLAQHYRRRWTYTGPDTLRVHIAKHGVPAEQLERLNTAALAMLHSALHEAAVEMKSTYTTQSGIRQQPVRILQYRSYCPNGVCPQR